MKETGTQYGEVRTYQINGGWWAETQLSRFHPVQSAFGATRDRALAGLKQRLQTWSLAA